MFKAGDIVRLKPRGPEMVVSLVADETVWCTWISPFGDGRPYQYPFKSWELAKIVEEDE